MMERERKAVAGSRWVRLLPGVLIAGLTAWLAGWIFSLGPALINDEYAAIDYFYRIAREGRLYPTPDKLHKPLSVLMGVFAWAVESPLGYAAAIAVFSVVFVVFFYLVVRRELGGWPAGVAAGAVALHPDLMYYSVTGSTVMPFCALALIGAYAVLRRAESERWLWVYAGVFFLAGSFRPEAWLFAGPAVIWWWPFGKSRTFWIKLVVALALIELAPVIWFGKDWLINGDLMHGMHIAVRDKAVGTGAPLSIYQTTRLFWVRVPEMLSRPAALLGLIGMVGFIRRQGWKTGLTHPLVVFPAVVSAYVWLIVYLGVWHAQRYWYFDACLITAFAAWLAVEILQFVRLTREALVKHALLFLALFPAAGFWLTGPGSAPADLWWLLAGGAFALLAVVPLLVWPELFFLGLGSLLAEGARVMAGAVRAWVGKSSPGPDREKARADLKTWAKIAYDRLGRLALAAVLVLTGIGYGLAFGLNYQRKTAELVEEAQKQKEIKWTARILMDDIPAGRGDRILLPSRRNEQLNWEFRRRELPDTFFFREAFYLWYNHGTEFWELHPDWIVYIPGDYQFRGPQDRFNWMEHQDHTVLRDVSIDLMTDLGLVRIFKVTYPPGFPARGPLPPIPAPDETVPEK